VPETARRGQGRRREVLLAGRRHDRHGARTDGDARGPREEGWVQDVLSRDSRPALLVPVARLPRSVRAGDVPGAAENSEMNSRQLRRSLIAVAIGSVAAWVAATS